MQSSQPSNRLVSLDVFRGITIAAMILGNNPGNWNAVYPPLLHAKWHGWTPTDLIFPFFLFIVGVAIVFSFAKRLQRPGGKKSDLWQDSAPQSDPLQPRPAPGCRGKQRFGPPAHSGVLQTHRHWSICPSRFWSFIRLSLASCDRHRFCCCSIGR